MLRLMINNFIHRDDASYLKHLSGVLQARNITIGFDGKQTITFDSPLEDHVAWVYQHIYSLRYPSGHQKLLHGIQHVTRAASWVPVLVNFYRRYGDQAAIDLTERKIKLLQLAMLFHDAGRKAEGQDFWEVESGLLLHAYLTKILGVSKTEADEIVIAVTLKDENLPKNILQKIVHDADCLEIVRARPHFDGKYLDFIKDFSNNSQAVSEMGQFIREVRSVVETQGDGFNRLRYDVKLKYIHANAYRAVQESMLQNKKEKKYSALDPMDPRDHYQIIPKFYQVLDEKTAKSISLLNTPSDDDPILVFRGVPVPAAKHLPAYSKRESNSKKILKPEETLGAKEVRKGLRIPTKATRAGYYFKDGNSFRSASLIGVTNLGRGGLTYCSAGFLLNAKLKNILKVDSANIGSGTGKKEEFKAALKNQTLSEEKKRESLFKLQDQLNMGGQSTEPKAHSYSYHTELTYHIQKDSFAAVCFTLDPTWCNKAICDDYYPSHRYMPALEAIFLQQEFEIQTRQDEKPGITLPIKEYSGIHNYLVDRVYSESDIVEMWRVLCAEYLESALSKKNKLMYQSVEQIKKAAVLSTGDLGAHYSKELMGKIDHAIAHEREVAIEKNEPTQQKKIGLSSRGLFAASFGTSSAKLTSATPAKGKSNR